MNEIKLNITIKHYQLDELSADDRELVERAVQATYNAYAEYSHFYVGAAVRLADGNIVIGANQENAAFPSGLCAERTALFAAQANHPDQSVQTLAIAARNDNGLLDDPVSILLYGKKGVYSVMSAKDLLPLSFVDSSMK